MWLWELQSEGQRKGRGLQQDPTGAHADTLAPGVCLGTVFSGDLQDLDLQLLAQTMSAGPPRAS